MSDAQIQEWFLKARSEAAGDACWMYRFRALVKQLIRERRRQAAALQKAVGEECAACAALALEMWRETGKPISEAILDRGRS